MHWADVFAEEIAKESERPLIAAGISPSGTIHVGSLREAITVESIRKALEKMDKDVRLVYLIDSADNLKKRSDFLPESYDAYVGKPISQIPCPCGKHTHYAHHFIQNFLDAMEVLGVKCELVWTHELYEQGKFAKAIDLCLRKRREVIDILNEGSTEDRKKGDDYSPYDPVCKKCGRSGDTTRPIFETYHYPTVEYQCECGHHGVADITKGDGKLRWRLEWPAKWFIFGTAAEPFGKDHAAAGGSYDTGKRIAEEIYGIKAPVPIRYEFVQLKGIGQIHKSTGSSVTGTDAINMMPPEVLKYLFFRVNPSKSIDYDPGMGVADMVDEYDRIERLLIENDVSPAEESSAEAYKVVHDGIVPEKLPLQVPYRHLINVVQIADSFEGVLETLKRTTDLTGVNSEDLTKLEKRVNCIRFWLNGFAPDDVKFFVYPTIPPGTNITMGDMTFFQELVERLNEANWEADTISQIISEVGKKSPNGLKAGFRVIYQVVIGKSSGPRVGPFLASMDKQFVINRFIQASKHRG